MNVYEMFVEHWKQPGFWVRRTTWANTVAKVVHVGGLHGPPPYYGSPIVRADVFDIHSGEMKDHQVRIDTAGTYKTWQWVNPPVWSGEAPFDPKLNRCVLSVPFEENKRASRMGARWSDLLEAWWIPEDDPKLLAKAESRGWVACADRPANKPKP